MSYFSQPKTERDKTGAAPTAELRPASAAQTSALGRGMIITGNIVSTDPVQIHGRVVGDIHASQLTICEGAQVEGNVTAQDAVIQGVFKGTIHGNSVKLHGTAVVEGEIFNRSLSIEQDARFEGMSRRLDKAVEGPSLGKTDAMKPSADVIPISGTVA